MVRHGVFLLILALSLVGCSSLSRLASYELTNTELTKLVDEELQRENFSLSVLGAEFPVAISNVAVSIGPDQSERIDVSATGEVVLAAMGQSFPVTLAMTLSGEPRVDMDQAAVFVESLTLRHSEIQAGAMRLNVSGLSTDYIDLLREWLAEHPVYRFDTTDNRIRVLQQTGVTVQVLEGRLLIQPG